MKIGVDASNIRTGGGKKHLEHFVINSIKEFKEIEFVIVSNKNINSMFSSEIRVTTITNPFLNINGHSGIRSSKKLNFGKLVSKGELTDNLSI